MRILYLPEEINHKVIGIAQTISIEGSRRVLTTEERYSLKTLLKIVERIKRQD